MRDLSLHVMDLAQNSVRAEASQVRITLDVDVPGDRLTLTIADDGFGMSPALLATVRSPFATTRTTRRVGLGIPLFEENAQASGGAVSLASVEGEGTRISGTFGLSHVDRPPLGDLTGTLLALIVSAPPALDYLLEVTAGEQRYELDTRALRQALGEVGLDTPEVVQWMRESMDEGIQTLAPALWQEARAQTVPRGPRTAQ